MTSPDEGPEWADEAHLDEVFSTWVPGPPDSASAAEKEMAGNNPPMEIPEQDVSDQDIEAALAAALAEAEQLSADAQDPDPLPAPPAATRFEPSEPASPSWLNVSEPDTAASTMAPVPVFEPEPEPDLIFDLEPEPEPAPETDPIFDTAPEPPFEPIPRAAPDPVFEPVFETEAQPVFDPVPEPEPVFEPAPPPPAEANRIARPWSRSDDDIVPDRKGKGRRR